MYVTNTTLSYSFSIQSYKILFLWYTIKPLRSKKYYSYYLYYNVFIIWLISIIKSDGINAYYSASTYATIIVSISFQSQHNLQSKMY